MAVQSGRVKLMGTPARVDKTNGYERAVARDAMKQQNTDIAREAAARRAARDTRVPLSKRVTAAANVLKSRSYVDSIAIIDNVSPMHRDEYLLAEEYLGLNRPAVLRRFGKPRKQVRARYLDEVGLTTPEQE